MIALDVIKAAYRQTKEGYTVTFVIHPQDKHQPLSDAPIGSQWRMELVPLDENGNAATMEREAPADTVRDNPDTAASIVTENTNAGRLLSNSPSREAGAQSAGERSPVSRLTRQAAICCKDPMFWAWLRQNGMPVDNGQEAAVAVRMICHVASRKEFIPRTAAGDRWGALYSKFVIWRDMPGLSDLGRAS